jgi:hypothetical protein
MALNATDIWRPKEHCINLVVTNVALVPALFVELPCATSWNFKIMTQFPSQNKVSRLRIINIPKISWLYFQTLLLAKLF